MTPRSASQLQQVRARLRAGWDYGMRAGQANTGKATSGNAQKGGGGAHISADSDQGRQPGAAPGGRAEADSARGGPAVLEPAPTASGDAAAAPLLSPGAVATTSSGPSPRTVEAADASVAANSTLHSAGGGGQAVAGPANAEPSAAAVGDDAAPAADASSPAASSAVLSAEPTAAAAEAAAAAPAAGELAGPMAVRRPLTPSRAAARLAAHARGGGAAAWGKPCSGASGLPSRPPWVEPGAPAAPAPRAGGDSILSAGLHWAPLPQPFVLAPPPLVIEAEPRRRVMADCAAGGGSGAGLLAAAEPSRMSLQRVPGAARCGPPCPPAAGAWPLLDRAELARLAARVGALQEGCWRGPPLARSSPPSPGRPPAQAPTCLTSPCPPPLARPRRQVQREHIPLLPLCACGHGTPALDPAYPAACCTNCPLHADPRRWAALLAHVLASAGLLGPAKA
jgi:hypothetical protein